MLCHHLFFVSPCADLHDSGKMADETGRKQVDFFSVTRFVYEEIGKEYLMAADVYESIVIKMHLRDVLYCTINSSSSPCLCF